MAKPFPVDLPPTKMKVLGLNIFPLMKFVSNFIPASMRQKALISKLASDTARLKDRFDCLGENPYAIDELLPGRLWRVKYELANLFGGKDSAKALGMDPREESFSAKVLTAAEQYGPEAVRIARDDIRRSVEMFEKEPLTDKGLFLEGGMVISSFVFKLKSGGLLLYAPVQVRDEFGFAKWLDELGTVEWIVIASATHTLCLPSVLARYPDAKVIGPPQAEAKLNYVSALLRGKVDFDSTSAADLSKANESLKPEGIELIDIKGDVCTNALLAIVEQKRLLACDLIYTHADGEGFLSIDKERFRKFLPEDYSDRLYKYSILAKPNSPNGFLATYRFRLMNPEDTGFMLFNPPALDGSTCAEMATSLREVGKASFNLANGVHFDSMSKEDYVAALDKNWNWLDGHPLL